MMNKNIILNNSENYYLRSDECSDGRNRTGTYGINKIAGFILMTCCFLSVSLHSAVAQSITDELLVTDNLSITIEKSTVTDESKPDAMVEFPAPRLIPSYASEYSSSMESEQNDDDLTVGLQGGKYGVGFAATFPAYGVSGTYQVNETLTAEAILGIFGVISNYGVRGWYRFNRNVKYDIYAYGSVSLLQYRYHTLTRGSRNTESVPAIGAGVGLEYGIQKLFDDEDLPPLFFNLEFGLVLANFDHYNLSSMSFGSGLHYRFGN